MGAIDNFASDLNGVLADSENNFRKLAERKQRLRDRSAEVAGKWSAYFDLQEKSIQAAEDALNRVSNLPLTPEPVVAADAPLSAVPKL
jgi:hypothetical protein